VVSVLATAIVLVGCGSPGPASSPPGRVSDTTTTVSATSGDFARSIDIGKGRTIYMTCSGSGSPTIVLVSGLGERADNWTMTSDPNTADPNAVYQQAARISRVCAYDRPGTASMTEAGWQASRSSPVPQPTTGTSAANDLHAMLSASGESGPYVLVGHSYGGDIIRLYAAAYPDSVAGLVLEDALSEDLPKRLTPDQTANLEKLNSPTVQGRPPGAETFEFGAVFPELRAISTVPNVPTIVLTADQFPITPEAIASGQLPPFVDQAFADALWSAQLAAQDELAAKFPAAIHITKTNAHHYIHTEQPQVVLDAISQVVDQVRGRTRPTR